MSDHVKTTHEKATLETGPEKTHEKTGAHQRYEQLYPHPAHGLDRGAARARVEANPAVMPPNPIPTTKPSWGDREIMGMRALPLAIVAVMGMFLPFMMRMRARRRRRGEAEELAPMIRRRAEGARKRMENLQQALQAAETRPRFIVLASRPMGKRGRKARALIMGKAAR